MVSPALRLLSSSEITEELRRPGPAGQAAGLLRVQLRFQRAFPSLGGSKGEGGTTSVQAEAALEKMVSVAKGNRGAELMLFFAEMPPDRAAGRSGGRWPRWKSILGPLSPLATSLPTHQPASSYRRPPATSAGSPLTGTSLVSLLSPAGPQAPRSEH